LDCALSRYNSQNQDIAMIKQLWQLFFLAKPDTAPVQDNDRRNQTNLTDQSDRLLRLESEIQTLRLTLNEKEQLISKLRTESDRYYS
jgi:predicted RNase H-like nuclease (RuvC/YqgF family)